MSGQLGIVSASPDWTKHCGEVFIVDDDEHFRDILASIVSLEGFPVAGFEDGETLLQRAGEKTPICIFLDVVMPGRSGLEVLKELKARDYQAPIFLTSARDDTAMVVEALKNGGQDFLRKPFDPYAAVTRVRDALELWNCRERDADNSELELLKVSGAVHLSKREAAEVVAQIVRGASAKCIGRAFGIDPREVERLRRNIMRKTGARDLTEFFRIVMN